jgi:hypothetical protein
MLCWFRDADACVHRVQAARRGDERVDVEFGDLGQVVDESADADQDVPHGSAVR